MTSRRLLFTVPPSETQHCCGFNSSASRRRERRHRLVTEALRLHGAVGIAALLQHIETDAGELKLDYRLEILIDAAPDAVAFFGAVR